MSVNEITKSQSNIKTIEAIMKKNNGYITSKELDSLGIHRMYLNTMYNEDLIERVATGIYVDSNILVDDYYVFSLKMPNTIYSHMTALYFHGLSIKAPDNKYDITVKNTYNNKLLKKHEVFYVSKDIYELGLTEVETPMGNIVRAYDKERCICDIIKSIKRMDLEHVKYSVRAYLKSKDKDIIKLSSYAQKMDLKDKVLNFVELLYEG